MNNTLLGKTLKAMYKQSGKTITQLADETGLSIDSINNLFYARVQKPGLADVDTLTKAMGFSLAQLMAFIELGLPPDADITDAFAKYTLAADEPAEDLQRVQSPAPDPMEEKVTSQIRLLKAEHEKQLDRFRATHLLYVEQIQNQYKAQLADMEKLLRNDKALNISRMTNRILAIALFLALSGLIALALYPV
ncbi:MAG: helix-turn-helix domain-containing protein [Oscillospiraceae bacterium]|nr:helix-turn-helix domain-containing protein [Oscillospiraceae bacterium]